MRKKQAPATQYLITLFCFLHALCCMLCSLRRLISTHHQVFPWDTCKAKPYHTWNPLRLLSKHPTPLICSKKSIRADNSETFPDSRLSRLLHPNASPSSSFPHQLHLLPTAAAYLISIFLKSITQQPQGGGSSWALNSLTNYDMKKILLMRGTHQTWWAKFQ